MESELNLLPPADLKEALRRIEREPGCGKPLTRSLQGCRSLRVGNSRIVYRDPVGDLVEVIAIGRRRDEEVYDAASDRL